ncbi:MAG: MarR family transcriptional regulator [Myxococcaceae bacterium]|nr:MarR family transcriptional regulator [Myxococcaceae bacterium]
MGARRTTTRKATLAAEVWQRLFDFIIETRRHREQVLSRYELTPNDSRALFTLDATEGRTMRSLAELWGCDASNATWIVDRLEKRGLAERRAHPGDRRVKLVALTPAGVKTRAELMEEMYRPPPELLELERSELEALSNATRKLGRPKGG